MTTRTLAFIGAVVLLGSAVATATRSSTTPRIAPPGVPSDAYLTVPAAAQGPPVVPEKWLL